MANEAQLSILKQGVWVWDKWRDENADVEIDLRQADLVGVDLSSIVLIERMPLKDFSFDTYERIRGRQIDIIRYGRNTMSDSDMVSLRRGVHLGEANLQETNLQEANLKEADLIGANLSESILNRATLWGANLSKTNLSKANLVDVDLTFAALGEANLTAANLKGANLKGTILRDAVLNGADLTEAKLEGNMLKGCSFLKTSVAYTIFLDLDLSEAIGLEDIVHQGPSHISTDTFVRSKGKIAEVFLRGCGLTDWEIEEVKLYNPELSNEEINKVLYRIYDLRATQALQISPLFVSYSHADSEFVDKVGNYLTEKGVRYWRDIHDMKAGRMEKQIDIAIRHNPIVLLVLSQHSFMSDWVQHEVRTARGLEKETGRDVLCPVALDDSWKSSRWPKRVMEQIMEYNILDFSEWKDDSKIGDMFRRLIDGLELFYKG